MYEYKLEAHLSALCAEYPRYTNLYSTWTLNKQACSDLLKSVVLRYPHFSMHDASHAEAVVSKIEMLLGDRVQRLSPTDTWLLLHAAYAHDLGMVVKWSEIEAVWGQPEFEDYLASLSTSSEPELRSAAAFVQNAKDVGADPLWPLKAQRYVTLINGAYFRSRHARLSKSYIHSFGQEFDLDLGHNDLIQPRIIKLLGQICSLHTEPIEKVLDLDFQTDGFDSDYAHPRWIAMLLRLGDLLDIDNGRFNTAAELSFGDLPETSVPHKEKHEATTHLLVTPEEIRFRSDCPSSEAYLETRQFVTWLEQEVDFLTKHWSKIAPKDLGGYAPRFDQKELLIRGVPDIKGVEGLKFEVSQDKAFQFMEGSNIYKDRFVFIREVIQNALDASKLQLWSDLASGTYAAWLGEKDPMRLQPYDLDKRIYASYPIRVRLSTPENGWVQVEVQDRGTGISVESFKRMCNVGVSNSGSEELKKRIRSIPNWLRPTAGFGIGLQSIFLLTDQFEIDTSTGTETFHAVFHSRRSGGYLQLQRGENALPRGTCIRLRFRMPENFQYSMGGETNRYLDLHLDPMAEDHTGEARVLEAIRVNCGDSMFPIQVTCKEASLSSLEIVGQSPVVQEDWSRWNDNYYYHLSPALDRLQLWNTQWATYGDIRFVPKDHYANRLRFKGMEIGKELPGIRMEGISTLLDIYGLDTKETITLDRNALTQEGRRQVRSILEDMMGVFQELLLKKLEEAANEEEPAELPESRFDPYTFWRICDLEQRKRIPASVLERIQDRAVVLVKTETGTFEKAEVPARELIGDLETLYFANFEKFGIPYDWRTIDYATICRILEQAENLEVERIVVDPILAKEKRHLFLSALRIPVPGQNLMLYTLSAREGTLLTAAEETKATVLKGLGGPIREMDYQTLYGSQKAKRYAIPALADYADLAVDHVPYGICTPSSLCAYRIVAPFVREDEEARGDQTKEQFVDGVMASPIFPKVVEYVAKHSLRKEEITQDQIIAAYKKLLEDYYDAMGEPS